MRPSIRPDAPGFTDKTTLLATIDAFARAADPRVVQVSVSLAGSHKEIDIIRPDGAVYSRCAPAGAGECVGDAGTQWPARKRLVGCRRARRL